MQDIFAVPKATLDDIRIARDENREILPVEIQSPLLGRIVSIRPMTWGYMKRNEIDMETRAIDWPTERKLAVLCDHYVVPDFSSLTVEEAEEDLDPLTLNHLVVMVITVSTPFFRLRQTSPGDTKLAEETLKRILEVAFQRSSSSSTS